MKQKAKPVTARIAPSGSGGPGTFRGCGYQIDYAVLISLNLIWQFLYEPLKSFSITIESRVVQPDGVTRWDIEACPPRTVSEAKVNVSKGDLLEFLERAGEANTLDASLSLVYGGCGISLLSASIRLHGLAVECGGDGARFDELVAREEIPDAPVILRSLGPKYMDLLPRLVFEDLPERALKRELQVRSRDLSPAHPQRLVDFLFRQFSEGASVRRRYQADELVSEIDRAGIQLTRPAQVSLTELALPAISALALLQATPSGIPGEVVASAVGATAEQLQDMLCRHDLVSVDEGNWRIRPLPYQVPVPSREDLLRRGFEGLLDFLSSHETDKRAEEQLRNSITLARLCLGASPVLALRLFQATEHIVKNLGDKHLLLEVSDICIHAEAQGVGADAEDCARARAQAMLCGTSWVFQRTGRLAESRLWAEKSLDLGRDIGWDRNTAFAMKCIGRIDRMEAELPEMSSEHRAVRLRASADKLLDAIRMFSDLGEFGPTNRQVGDCYSLLARTCLAARKQSDASVALRKAYEILPEGRTKEFFDLKILTGDFDVVSGAREHAELLFSEVIDEHSQENREHSEIYARALSKRAANRAVLNRRQLALSDYLRAAEVWRSLDEHEEAAKMEWARIELDGKVEAGTLHLFSVESSILTRIAALRTYLEQLGSSKALARRSRPTTLHVDQYLRDARKQSALNYPEW
jgi:tetratricopeptide (TPR) repeat protein